MFRFLLRFVNHNFICQFLMPIPILCISYNSEKFTIGVIVIVKLDLGVVLIFTSNIFSLFEMTVMYSISLRYH